RCFFGADAPLCLRVGWQHTLGGMRPLATIRRESVIGELSKVGIVGAGYMGRRIAYSCVLSGRETRLYDISPDVSGRAYDAVRSLVIERDGRRLHSEGVASTMNRLSVTSSLENCVSGVDLVEEAVPEVLETKRQVFAEIDRHAGPETLIATNTSSLL